MMKGLMKKETKSKAPAVPKVDPYLEGMMSKLLDRLVSLEKKMETVIQQTSQKQVAVAESSRPYPQQSSQPSGKPHQHHDRTMFEAICAECSKVCEVPFRPTEDRPVYCKDCWGRRKQGQGRSSNSGMPVMTPVSMSSKPSYKPSFKSQSKFQGGGQHFKKPKFGQGFKKSRKGGR
jgi:CxxC-x17-CxxC domain-containing protein